VRQTLFNPRKPRSLVALGFSVLALAAACGGASASSGGSSTTSSTAAPTGAGGEDQVVSKAIQVQNHLRDLTLNTESDTTQGGRTFTTQAKVRWTADPERFYSKTASSVTSRETEVIIDSATQTTYVRSGTSWIKSPAGSGTSSLSGGFLPSLKGDAFKGFKVLGQESVEGKPTWHLSGPMPFTPGSSTSINVPNVTGTLDVWVGKNDYQLVKQVEDLRSSDGGGFSMKATVVVDSVDKGLHIDLPVTQ
jgi:hypothetical protein